MTVRTGRMMPLVATVTLVLSVASVAWAHHTDITDPNDTTGALDIRQVRVGHHAGKPVEFTVITAARWKPIHIWDRGFFTVSLDTRGDEREEYRVVIRSTGRQMDATLWWVRKDPARPDKLLRHLDVFRKTTDGVSVRLPPLWKLRFGEGRAFYRWWAESILTSQKCPRTCFDRAPNVRLIEQPRH
jgi:hypothetical protein